MTREEVLDVIRSIARDTTVASETRLAAAQYLLYNTETQNHPF